MSRKMYFNIYLIKHAYHLQFRWISKDFQEIRKLKYAYIAKALIVTNLIFLSVGFATAMYVGSKHDNGTATFVAGVFSFRV